MDRFDLLNKQIKTLQIELNQLIDFVGRDRLNSAEVTRISEQLDQLIVELHYMVRN